MARRSFFTTFEISQICEVNPTTVQNWVKENKLKAYVTPGGHRRVKREDLAAFMKQFGLPIPPELLERPYVLIVDDESDVIELLRSALLTRDGAIEILGVQSGVEALLEIGERKPDLLVLDIMMPGLNGFDVCKRLKASKRTRNIKILAISGSHESEVRARILSAGADVFLSKPLDMLEFQHEALRLMRS